MIVYDQYPPVALMATADADPIRAAGVVFPPVAVCLSTERTPLVSWNTPRLPPPLAKARWHDSLACEPVGYPISLDRAVRTCRSTQRGERALHCLNAPTCNLHLSAKHISYAVGGNWYGGITGQWFLHGSA
ncbi:hypothetical protein ACEPAG_7070 [Sanghuangporus baumii]